MPSRRRRLTGRVVSDKMDKTVVVVVERTKRHPLYHKVIKIRKRYMAHDAENACRAGDLVTIVEARPLSRHKRWAVETVLERAAEELMAKGEEL
ncbi:MAG: 30S ribosomal protein S17 [Anaerolineae bacterium]|nr:30S ribosomal protein S17 [Anaerolineae bacterium]